MKEVFTIMSCEVCDVGTSKLYDNRNSEGWRGRTKLK